MLITCPAVAVSQTLIHLQEGGARACECVVLWLGRRHATGINVERVYRPLHHAEADFFHIPREGMTALHDELRRDRLMVAAQVHSHPGEAFHSLADDRWAIVRHEGALSLVVPGFAFQTQVDNFLDQTKVFRFSGAAEWLETPRADIERTCLQIC
jgi:proteasome lid subunit RPN8/RPN11